MLRLVETYLASARKPDFGNQTPSDFLSVRTVYAFFGEGGHLSLQIIAHKEEFVRIVII